MADQLNNQLVSVILFVLLALIFTFSPSKALWRSIPAIPASVVIWEKASQPQHQHTGDPA